MIQKIYNIFFQGIAFFPVYPLECQVFALRRDKSLNIVIKNDTHRKKTIFFSCFLFFQVNLHFLWHKFQGEKKSFEKKHKNWYTQGEKALV